MRARKRLAVEDEAEVPMSPLIDCVFLLLIFFLVTTMIKRKEAHIPNTLPDPTAAVATTTRQSVLVVALDVKGQYWRDSGRKTNEGAMSYEPIGDLAAYLKLVVDQNGTQVLRQPIRIDLDREVPFQDALKALDIVKLQGFEQVGMKTRLTGKL